MGHLNELTDFAALVAEPVAECLVARVERADGERAALMLGGIEVSARRAVSCLITLAAGDTVSVVRVPGGAHYVTDVLLRETSAGVELSSMRPIVIHSGENVRLSATKSIDLDAGQNVRLRAPVFEAMVGRFAALAKTMSVSTGEALLNSRVARLCSELVDIAAQRIGVSARHSHRQIDGTEQLRCRVLDMRADELANLRAKATLIKANDLVKIDAAQIQIG